MTEDPVVREVIRRFDELATRLESVSTRLETTYVRKDNFESHKELSKEKFDGLIKDVADLQDDKKWLTRLVLGFIVLTILGLVVAQRTGAA